MRKTKILCNSYVKVIKVPERCKNNRYCKGECKNQIGMWLPRNKWSKRMQKQVPENIKVMFFFLKSQGDHEYCTGIEFRHLKRISTCEAVAHLI